MYLLLKFDYLIEKNSLKAGMTSWLLVVVRSQNVNCYDPIHFSIIQIRLNSNRLCARYIGAKEMKGMIGCYISFSDS